MAKRKEARLEKKKVVGTNKKNKPKTEYQLERDAYKAMPKHRKRVDAVPAGKPQFVN